MPIEAQMFDGTVLEFPDNTDPAVIDKAAKEWIASNKTEINSDNHVSFLDAVKAGIDQLGGAAHALEAGVDEFFGNQEAKDLAIESYNQSKAKIQERLQGATDWRDIVKSDNIGEGTKRTFDFIKEQFGLNSPQMATIMAGGFGTAAAAPFLPHPIATAISKVGGFTIGATMTALPMFTGMNLGRQIDEGKDLDIVKAGAYAVPQALTEAFITKVFTKTGLTNVGEKLLGKMSGNMATRVGQKLGEALAVGVPGEVIQQGFERAAAGLETNPLKSDEAFNEYLDVAVATAAALSPFGSLGAFHEGKGGQKDKGRKNVEEVLKEQVESSPEPKSNFFKDSKEASQGLRSLGINPDVFTASAQIKAANLMVDRIDQGRMKFMDQAVPEGAPLKQFLMQSTGLTPNPYTIKGHKIAKNAVPSQVLESSTIPEIAEVLPSVKPQDSPMVPRIDLNAPTGALTEQARVMTEMRQNRFTGAPVPNSPSLTDVPGQIVADFELMKKDLNSLYKMPKADLFDLAEKTFKIPLERLKSKDGKVRPKRDIVQEIALERSKTWEPFQPKIMQPLPDSTKGVPLQRITPEDISSITSEGLAPLALSKKSVVSKIAPVTKQFTRINKELKVKTPIDTDLQVDQTTGEFKSPLRAAQAGNILFTTVNFTNTDTNLGLNFQEAWQYVFDNMSDTAQKAIYDEVPNLSKSLVDANVVPDGTAQMWSQSDFGKDEALSYAFAEYAQSARTGEPLDFKLPKDLKVPFDKLVNTFKKGKQATRGLGFNSFEDVFSEVSETGKTPRAAVFDSVTNLRHERLKRLSDDLQFQHWKNLDNIKMSVLMDEAIEKGVKGEAMMKTGLYNRSVFSSFVHLASKNPVAQLAYNLKREQETLQSRYLTEFATAGETFFREPSKEVRIKAAEVLNHLRNTSQPLSRDSTGAISFRRGDDVVTIKHPAMIEVIESLNKWSQAILNVAEGDTRASINELIPGALTQSLADIQKSINQVEKDNSIDPQDLEFVKEQFEVLENLRTLKGKPFVPHMRFGSYGFTVHAASSIGKDGKVKPNARPVYHAQVEKGKHKGRWDEFQYKKVQGDLSQYRNKDYVIFEDSVRNPFEMTYGNVYDKIQRDSISLELIAGLLGSDKTEEYFVDVKGKLDRKTKYRGFRKRFGEADNIAGYSTDWDRVINSYNTGAAHFFAKAKFAPHLDKYNAQVQSTMGNEHAWIKKKVDEYVEYNNSPHDSFQLIREINFLWTMGGNFSSALLQVMTLPTSTLGSMTQYNPSVYQNAKLVSKYMTIAFKEFPNSDVSTFENGVFVFRLDDPKLLDAFRKKHKFSEDEIDFLKGLFKNGRTGAAFLEEQAGKRDFETRTKAGTVKEKMSKYSHILGVPISAMEQATRFSTAMAHYKMFKENPAAVERALVVLKDDHRFQGQRAISGRDLITDLAYFGLDEAHAVFGKVGRGDILRGGFGAFVFPFMTYPQNFLEFIGRMAGRGKEGKQALMTTLGSLFLFSGLIGLPGGEFLKEMLEALYKEALGEEIDLDYLIREKLTDITGDPRPGMFLTQGLFRAFLNMDVSRRIGVPIPGQELVLAAMGVRGDMSDLIGVQGSMLSQGISAWRSYATDESGLKVASLVTPMAVSNILKSMDYVNEGVRTAKGTQLVSREDIRNNPSEIFMRAMGITTGRIASAREEQYWKQLENTKFRPKMNSFRATGKNLMTKYFHAVKDGKPEEAAKYQTKYKNLTLRVMRFTDNNQIPYDMGAFHRAVMDAVDQRVYAGVRYEDLDKGAKGKFKSLKSVSGKDLYKEDNK